MKTVRLTKDSQRNLLDSLLKRSPNNYGQYESVVADIIANVREKGDKAVFNYTSQFDKWNCTAENIRVRGGCRVCRSDGKIGGKYPRISP